MFCSIKRMIGGILAFPVLLTDCQTLNGQVLLSVFVEAVSCIDVSSGPFLVSRTGDAG